MTSPTVFCLSVQLRPNSQTTKSPQNQRSQNIIRAPTAVDPNSNGIIFLRGVRSDNGRIILTRDDSIRLQDGVLSLQSPSVSGRENLNVARENSKELTVPSRDKQRNDNENVFNGEIDLKRQNAPLLLYATGSDVANGNVAFLRENQEEVQDEQKEEKMVVPVGSDGEPIKLPENLESLPRADHFPTQRHRWNTNEVYFLQPSSNFDIPYFENAYLLPDRIKPIIRYQECDDSVWLPLDKCSNDCTSRITCQGGIITSKQKCPINQPYCQDDDGKFGIGCTSSNQECNPVETCKENTFIPDLLNCQKFTYCTEDYSFGFKCEKGFVFDSFKNVCRSDLPCENFDKHENCLVDDFVPYFYDSQKFVWCGPNGPFLHTCEKYHVFDKYSKKCELDLHLLDKYNDL